MNINSNEAIDKNTYVIEVTVNAEEFEQELQAVFLKRRRNITVPGFRKGKATRKMIEKVYGENVFFEEAVNKLYPTYLAQAIDELGKELTDTPKAEITSVSKEDGVTFKATCIFKPEVNISDYIGINVEKHVKTIGDTEVDEDIKKIQNKNARIMSVDDRAVINTDVVTFDFEGYVNGETFEGGSAESYTLEIGSNQFIPGFEEQLIGKNINEDFDINITFPEDYHAENLKGQDAVFKCRIHSIRAKEFAEIDDEFAKDVSEFDTLDELKADIKVRLEEEAEKTAAAELEDKISDVLISKLEADIPDVMYENRITELVKDWEYKSRYQGIDIDTYFQYTGSTMEEFREGFREYAVRQVKLRLALEKIVSLESIEVEDSAVEAEYEEMAKHYKMNIDKVKKLISFKNLSKDLQIEKAFNLIKDKANVTNV